MHSGRLVRWGLGVQIAVLVAILQPAAAITRRADRDDSLYTDLAATYTNVGSILANSTSFGSGTLIAPNYVLTAAHVIGTDSSITFTLNGTTYEGAWATIHSNWQTSSDFDWDIGLIRLKAAVTTVDPAPRYTGTDELAQAVTLVGYGKTGTGLTGAILPQGTKRACQNVLDDYGTLWGYTTQVLLADFDDGSELKNRTGSQTPLDLEGLVGRGDSGGPAFIDVDGVPHVAGVITSVFAVPPTDVIGKYGDTVASTRVSSFNNWIDSIMSTGYNVYWVADSGAFNAAANWQTTYDGQTKNVVPGLYDTAYFDRASTYVVTWPTSDFENARLVVSNGNVTFNLNAHTYALMGGSSPTMVVGTTAGLNPSLTITNGSLYGDHVTLAQVPGAGASLSIGSGATFSATRLDVFGNATMNVASGGTATIAGDSTAFVLGAGATFTKEGTGSLDIGGPVDFGAGSIFGINDGTVTFSNGGTPGTTGAGQPTSLEIPDLDTGLADGFQPSPVIVIVPEPATLAFLGGGLAVLLSRRRRT